MVKGAKIARLVRQTRTTPHKRRVLAAVLARSPRPPLHASLVLWASLLKSVADRAQIAQRDSLPARERRVAPCVKLAPIRAARAQQHVLSAAPTSTTRTQESTRRRAATSATHVSLGTMMTTMTLAHSAWHGQAQLSVRLEPMTRTAMELAASHARLEKLIETSIRPPNVRIAWPASSHLRLGQRNAPFAQQVRRQMVSIPAPHAQLASISVLRRASAWTVLLAWLI